MRKLFSLVLGLSVLIGCTPTTDPTIKFMGISPGGMQSTLEELKFGDRFSEDIKEFVAVVALENAQDGTNVQATWFSPDERSMPLGRTTIVTQSGATIARFTFATTQEWNPFPYKLMVDVMNPETTKVSASGSLQFYIGMTDAQITQYQKEWTEYSNRFEEQKAAMKAEGEFEQALAASTEKTFASPAILALKKDLLGDTENEYVFVDTAGQPPFMPAQSATLQMEGTANQFVVVHADGTQVLSMLLKGRKSEVRSGDKVLTSIPVTTGVKVSLLATGTWVLQWEASGKNCVQEIRKAEDAYEAAEAVCS